MWQSFSGTPSEWGQTVETAVADVPAIKNDKQWVHNVRVTTNPGPDGHRRIVSIGRTLTPPEITGTTEIDFVRVKRRTRLVENAIWDMSKIEEIYEMKNSLSGRLDSAPDGQRARLLALIGGDKSKLIVCEAKYAFQGGQLRSNPRWKIGGYMFKTTSGVATTAFVVMSMIEMSEATDDFVTAYETYQSNPSALMQQIARTEMEAAMQRVVNAADPSGGFSVGLLKAIVMDKKFLEALDQIHNNP